MRSDRVTCTVVDGGADVRLNRPDKLNALDAEMFDALGATGDALHGDPDVRAVVLSGEGRGFCAGLDLGIFAAEGPSDLLSGRTAGRPDNRAQHAAWVWHELEIPVIAALHGVVFGGGIQIAMGADLRIAATDSRLSVMEVRWGLVPDMSGTHTLPRLVGLDVAKELTWTGRIVGGDEALRIGLVTRLSEEPRAEALELARDLAGRNPDALRLGKALLNHSAQSSAADQLCAEEAAARSLVGSPNQHEAVASQQENREPRFVTRAT
jgi:enoyl-CoA hydratase/carnithine racemase